MFLPMHLHPLGVFTENRALHGLDKQDGPNPNVEETLSLGTLQLHRLKRFSSSSLPSHSFPSQPQMPRVGPFLNCSQAETKSPSTLGSEETPCCLFFRENTTP